MLPSAFSVSFHLSGPFPTSVVVRFGILSVVLSEPVPIKLIVSSSFRAAPLIVLLTTSLPLGVTVFSYVFATVTVSSSPEAIFFVSSL